MNFLAGIIAVIWNRLLQIFGRRYRVVYVANEPPEKLAKSVLYIVLDDGEPWHAVLACPCGCSAAIHLNLFPEDRPCWKITDELLHRCGVKFAKEAKSVKEGNAARSRES